MDREFLTVFKLSAIARLGIGIFIFVVFVMSKVASELHFTVSITSDAQMRKLNQKHRGVSHSTDVLSFELKEKLPDGEWVGEVVVSKDYARRQAKRLDHSYEEEVAFLVSHGVMHLMGKHHE